MTRILLTGREGQIGWELQRTLAPLGDVVAFDRAGLDITDPGRLRAAIREIEPRLIVNAAAYTGVERAEADEALAGRINAQAPRVLAEEAQRLHAWLVHYSTDYVFDGSKPGAYSEDDAPNPANAYGRTKLAGEEAVASVGGRYLILRTSWIYADRGTNFLRTMQRLAQERDEVRVVDDQIGAPTWARIVAESTALCALQVLRAGDAADERAGLYHLTCGGETSWYGFARALFDAMPEPKPRLIPIATGDYRSAARRPRNSVLDQAKIARVFGVAPVDWQLALALCLSTG